MKRFALWIAILLMLGWTSCNNGKHQQHISLEIEDILAEDTPWYLYTYGTNDIIVDTIEVKKNGKIKWSKELDIDSLDLLLLYNSRGLLELPFLPDRKGDISATINKEGLALKGVQEIDSIQSWYKAKNNGMEEMISFLSNYNSHPVVFIMAVDAINRDSVGTNSKRLLEIQRVLSNRYSDMVDILGLSYVVNRLPEPTLVPFGFRIAGQQSHKTFKDFIGKKELMVINVMQLTPEDSIAFKKQKDYLNQLDSLGLLSYNVLLNEELPKELSKGTNRYFLVDSTDYAVEYIKGYSIQNIPTYMLVDSLRHIRGSWTEADSLVQYVKKNKNVGNRVD